MKCPFPGMDPYLETEALWPEFHHLLVMSLYQVLLPGLVDRYRAVVGSRRYREDDSPDAAERRGDFLEIPQRDNRLVTLVDVVSPAVKTTASGRQAYLDQRLAATTDQANLVEIDLVIQGEPTLTYSRDGLPHWDYAVTVVRTTHPEQYEIYTSTLQKRLPRFRLPLAADDRDTILDLQAAFARCYEQGGFFKRIDYRRDPAVMSREADLLWLDATLQAQGLRASLSHEQVALAAYDLWERDGRQHGRDKEYWYRAMQQLRLAVELSGQDEQGRSS